MLLKVDHDRVGDGRCPDGLLLLMFAGLEGEIRTAAASTLWMQRITAYAEDFAAHYR